MAINQNNKNDTIESTHTHIHLQHNLCYIAVISDFTEILFMAYFSFIGISIEQTIKMKKKNLWYFATEKKERDFVTYKERKKSFSDLLTCIHG